MLCLLQATAEWLLLGICNICPFLHPSSCCHFPLPLFVSYSALLAHAGIGGDAFCLYFDAKTKKVSAMLGNGGAPGALTLQVTQ